MMLTRLPGPALRPFVQLLWASANDASRGQRHRTNAVPWERAMAANEAALKFSRSHPGRLPQSGRERVLPTGLMHIALRLSDIPFRIFHSLDNAGPDTVASAIVGGARTAPYMRDIAAAAPSVGALLRPGACAALLGCPAALAPRQPHHVRPG